MDQHLTVHDYHDGDAERSAAVKKAIGDRLGSDPENRVRLRVVFNDRMTGAVWHQV